MRKTLVFAAGLLAVSTVASATPLTLSVSQSGWGSAVGGACVDIDNNDINPSAQDEVRWGGGVLSTDFSQIPAGFDSYLTGGDACMTDMSSGGLVNVSGYNFDPFDGQYSFPGTTSPFSLGTFQHLNYQITTGIKSIDYQLQLMQNGNPFDLDLTFIHDETPNTCTAPGANCSIDDDIVKMEVVPSLPTLFDVDGVSYLFTVLGFSPTGLPGSFSSQMISPECYDSRLPCGPANTTQLWASIEVVPTPEPASLVLLGTGLVGTAVMARRRQRKQKAQSLARD